MEHTTILSLIQIHAYSDSVTINQPNNSLQINTQGIMDQTCSNPNGSTILV